MKLVEDKISLKDKIRLYRPYVLLFIALVLLFSHIFGLVFGDKSIIVLVELRKQERNLQESVKFYQKQNAYLQKEIFELNGG